MPRRSQTDVTRAAWVELIGAHRPPDARWQAGPPSAWADGIERRELRLHGRDDQLTAVLLRPASGVPSPVVVVPFYDVESLLGLPSPLYPRQEPGRRRDFVARLAARGIGAMAVPWWAEAAARPHGGDGLDARYGPVAAAHAAAFPGVTGLGRSVADLLVAVDALCELDGVDAGRIGAFGHSLGGKLATFLAALDPRVRATAAHEAGLGFSHSNWSAPWYLDDRVPADRDMDELTGLIAPRAFLYAGGGSSDGPHNAELAVRARAAWQGGGFDVLMHEGGHPLPEHVFEACAAWLARHLDYPLGRSAFE